MKHITENEQFKKYQAMYSEPKPQRIVSPWLNIGWFGKILATFLF